MVKEIEENRPDVLCLQGVSDFVYFESALGELGMTGCFEKTKASAKGEGCGVFVRADTFRIDKTYDLKGVGTAALVMVSFVQST